MPVLVNRIPIWILIFIILIPAAGFAQKERENYYYDFLAQPLTVKNQYIFYLPYLFMPFEKAKVISEGQQEVRFSIYKSSTFLDHFVMKPKDTDGTEMVDVETTTFTLSYVRNIGKNWEIRGSLPVVYHSGGFMDPLIENFHHGFTMPNGGRETWKMNDIHIEWNGLKITESQGGVGDLALYLKKQLGSGNPLWALSFGLEIPSMKKGFISSRTLDLGAALHFDYYGNMGYFYATAGGVYFIGEGEYRKELARDLNFTLHLGAGIGVRVSKKAMLFMQIYAQTSPYSTGVERIDRVSIVHSFGVRWKFKPDFLIQISADEDSFTFSTTDIGFNIQGEYRF